ncbi:MAG TPA: hypothetical protein VGR46_01870 [Candidatus Limnocylindria bacterium]|nr:hypothetical protein [Candidatus Limnocylindria bacterium]
MRPWLRRLHLGPREQTNAPLGDWAMSRVLASLALSVFLVVSMLALGVDAMAGPEWCEDDPVFLVNGALFELEVPSNVTAASVEGLLGPGGSSDLDVGVSSAPGRSNVRTQVGYSFIGL